MTKRKLLNGVILAFSVIFIRFIDVYVYNMHVVLVIVLAIGLIAGLMNLAKRFSALDEQVSKQTALLVNSAVVLMLLLSFFALD